MQNSVKMNQISIIILRMNRIEELRNSYRRIKNATKPFCGDMEKVLTNIRNNENHEEVTNDKEIIEKALCNENMKKFTMAYSSPFLQKPLLPLLQQTTTSKTAN